MIADEQLYDSLLANREKVLQKDIDLLTDVVTICCAIKAGVVSRDERETGADVVERQGALLESYKLPQRAPKAASVDDVMAVISRDKKARAGVTPWVLLDRLGHAVPGHRVNREVAEHVIGRALGAG
jgi:3-dehydroquinate synthetase